VTRLRGTGDDGLDDRPEDPRQLAAGVPRGGAQHHPDTVTDAVCCGTTDTELHHQSHTDPDLVVGQLPHNWRTT
jgi:hypothetical protein